MIGNFEWMATFCLILLGLIFAPFYFRNRVSTLPEYLEKRFGSGSRTFLAFMSVVGALFIHIGMSLYAGATIFEQFFGINVYEQTTHTTEVNLTPKEADEGTRVPVALPVHLTCPVCGGRGEVWNEVCGVCTGTGGGLLSHNLNVRVPPGVHHGTRLRFCVSPPFAPETHVEVRITIP